jgi:hypothetical protein
MSEVRVRLSTMLGVVAIASAAAFALGRTTGTSPPPVAAPEIVAPSEPNALPAGHPPLEPSPPDRSSKLTWKPPPKWEVLPNTSTMRLATYRPPRAPGDTADADVSVTQAGGSVDANADRWVGQFDSESQKSAKRTKKTIAGMEVTIVEVEGVFTGMAGSDRAAQWALVGAIVPTPDMPHFFKMTGPRKTVAAARKDFEAMLATISMQPSSDER